MKRCFLTINSAIVCLAAILLADDCRSQESTRLRSVSVSEAGGPLTIFSPYLVAIGSGAFERRGIRIDQQPFGSGASAYAAFDGGSVQFCICGVPHTISAATHGRDVIATFNQFLGGAVVFIGAKRYEKERGTDLRKYDGGTWAYSAEGTASHLFMVRAARAAGLDWKKQKGLAVGSVDAFIPTLRQERADIVAMDGKSAAVAVALGVGYPVLNTVDPKVSEPIWGEQIGLPLITTRALAASDPKLVQDMVDAMREALLTVQKYRDDPAKLFKLYPAETQEANKTDFAKQWDFWKLAYNVDGTFTDKQLEETIKFLMESGLIKTSLSVEESHKIFDNRWATQAIANVPAATQ
jgi:NitT/TauT family transport system substrate-binding protein